MRESLEEALDETTPGERLRELAISSQLETRIAVAQNPNTPVDVLIKLFSEAPLNVLNNPALSLLLLENPCFFEDLYKSNKYIFQQFDLPIFFLNWALYNYDYKIRASLAISSKISLSFLTELAEDKEARVRSNIAENSCIPVKMLEKLSQDSVFCVRYQVAKNSNTPGNVLDNLAMHCNKYFQCRIAKHIPEETQERRQLREDKEILCVAAHTPLFSSLAPQIQKSLSVAFWAFISFA